MRVLSRQLEKLVGRISMLPVDSLQGKFKIKQKEHNGSS
jgi:hypothetical protein